MKQITKRVVAFFAAMGLMVSGLSLNEPASADAKAVSYTHLTLPTT